MLRIAICDDEKVHLHHLSVLLKSVLNQSVQDIEIKTFTSGYLLMDVISKHPNDFDLIFLDNLMPDINGIDVAKNIRLFNEKVPLIFVTTTKEYAFDSYQVNASQYLLKPITESQLKTVLTDVLSRLSNTSQQTFTISLQNEIHQLSLSSICYFESKLRKIVVYTMSEQLTFYEKMSNIESQLPKKQFIRCHQSYLINAHHVKTIKNNVILLKNSHEIPISKKYQTEVKELFMQFLNHQFI